MPIKGVNPIVSMLAVPDKAAFPRGKRPCFHLFNPRSDTIYGGNLFEQAVSYEAMIVFRIIKGKSQ
jgi:hypothetical protein